MKAKLFRDGEAAVDWRNVPREPSDKGLYGLRPEWIGVTRMLRKKGLTKASVAALMLAAAFPTVGFVTSTPLDPPTPRIAQGPAPTFDFAAATAGWVDEFETFAARRVAEAAADTRENVVVIAKAMPDVSAPLASPSGATTDLSADAETDTRVVTGTIRPHHLPLLPLLPPVPGPDAFKVQSESAKVLKGDRLGASQRIDLKPSQPAAAAPDASPNAGLPPHAELAPMMSNPAAPHGVKMAMLPSVRSDRLKPAGLALATMKPLDLSPQQRPDPFFQGPPMPADPTIDPDAPVLGYADQMSSAEAPFKSLFAVTPAARKSWLAVDNSPPKAKATKPGKVAHAVHRRSRKRG